MKMLKNKLFLRIYAGLVVLIVLIVIFCTFLVQVVNNYRVQNYRESLVDGVAYVMSESLARQNPMQQQHWINDASYLLGAPLKFISKEQADLSYLEQRRIDKAQAVVRYNEQIGIVQVIIAVKGYNNEYLNIELQAVGERQIKALSVFVIEYLAAYPGFEQQHINLINDYFTYNLELRDIRALNLDNDQLGRLKQDQSLLLYRDNTKTNASFYIVSPIASDGSKVLVLGAIPIYKDMPLYLAVGITLLALLLLSLGVYMLILPVERKIKQVTEALDFIKGGDLSRRLKEEGDDEMTVLSSSFNNMVEHIQRLIEAQRELMRAVSHELRTPVARIRFGLQMLAEEDDATSRSMQVDFIDKDIEELNTLIDEIMTYAKLEQGMPSFEFVKVSLNEVIEQVATETKALKTGKEIEVDLPSSQQMVDAEYRYLHRVVQNLSGNAVRYANTKVRISGGIVEDMAYVCVEDDGVGIPEADRERVFEAFARLDDSRTRASGGYGLGLSIVGRIAYWFGGKVKVDSSPDLGGARFIMVWPAKSKD